MLRQRCGSHGHPVPDHTQGRPAFNVCWPRQAPVAAHPPPKPLSSPPSRRGQKICLDADEVEETLTVEGQTLRYVQVEANFSQPNAGISVQMLAWARRAAQGSGARDLLELYCGNGNFTAALAPRFRRVVATEVSKRSVAAARRNCAQNGVNNVFLARMRSEEFTEAWRTGGKKERCGGSGLVAKYSLLEDRG